MNKVISTVLALGALIALMLAFTGHPDAQTCAVINSITPHACSTGPNVHWIVAACVFGAGALFVGLAHFGRTRP